MNTKKRLASAVLGVAAILPTAAAPAQATVLVPASTWMQDGKIAWSVRSTVDSLGTDGRRVFASGRVLTAYSAADGHRLWSRGLAEPGKPIRAGGLLYVTNGGPALAILSPVNGGKLADGRRYRTPINHVVVAGGRLFSTDGTSIRAYAF